MRPIFGGLSLALAICLLSAAALPGARAAEPPAHDHTHATAPVAAPDSSASSDMMQRMQGMHEKMMTAKTPAERQALMADHMKTMQQGMQMMQQMGSQSGKGAISSKKTQMRMDMMTMMMQMMMDQQSMSSMPMAAPSAPPLNK